MATGADLSTTDSRGMQYEIDMFSYLHIRVSVALQRETQQCPCFAKVCTITEDLLALAKGGEVCKRNFGKLATLRVFRATALNCDTFRPISRRFVESEKQPESSERHFRKLFVRDDGSPLPASWGGIPSNDKR